MAILPPMHGPRTALRDLAAFMRQRSREQLLGAALAVLTTIVIVILFLVDAKINTRPGPTITYVESWPVTRSDAEIIAKQKADKAAAEERARANQKKFQDLQNQLGIE